MKVISKLEQQKRHPDRVNVYLDGEFAFGVRKEVAHKFALRKGRQLDPDMVAEITYEEEFSAAKRKALKYLERRMRSEHEVRTKLRDAGFPEKIIGDVVLYLEKINCLNDQEYAAALKRDLRKNRSAGKQLLKVTFRKRGISEEIAGPLLNGISREEEEETARALAEKLLRSYLSSRKEVTPLAMARRVSQALARRGFSWGVISDIIKESSINHHPEE